jgi:hypothetical protein
VYKTLVGKLKEEDRLGDLGVDGKILKKQDARVWTGFI